MIQCPECGSDCSYVSVNGITVSVCVTCYQAVIADSNPPVLLRLNTDKLRILPMLKRRFVAVALAMQLMYEQWDVISQHVPMAE